MGIFNFFKKTSDGIDSNNISKLKNNEIILKNDFEVVQFLVENIDLELFDSLVLNDFVTLWTKPNLDRIHIYARGGIGGSGRIGFVPNEYFNKISNHISTLIELDDNKKDYGAYFAEIIEKKDNFIKIEITLFSPEKQKSDYQQFLHEERSEMEIALRDEYFFKSPITIEFNVKNSEEPYLVEKLGVNLGTKEFYIENPQYYFIQLLDEQGKIVAETNTPKDKVLKIIRAFHSNNLKRATVVSSNTNYIKMEFASTEE